MDWFTVALSLFDHAIEGYTLHEKNKYRDRKIKLESEYYEEKKKPEDARNNALLDDLEHELFVLCSTIGSAVGGSEAAPKP